MLFAHRQRFAVFIDAAIVDHHRYRQPLYRSGFLLGMADGAIDLIVGGFIATGILRPAAVGRGTAGGGGIRFGTVGVIAGGVGLGGFDRRGSRRAGLIG
ncbi:hypothetical protein D3C80_1965100 [compost metagenome]